MRRPAAVVLRPVYPLSGSCGSCGALGAVTDEDLKRWQRGEFSWSDWAWCKANWRNISALAIPLLGPGIVAYSLTVGFGRLAMHPLVPNIDPGAARTWPCLTEQAQRGLNALGQLEAQKQNQQIPTELPPLPPLLVDQTVPGPTDVANKAKTARTVLGLVAVGVIAVVIMRRRQQQRQR